MILYHGTSEAALDEIRQHGVAPRGGDRKRNNWKHTIGSNPKAVYLSKCYALHFASQASNDKENAAIIEVDLDALNQWQLHADEDAIEQSNRGRDDLPKDWDIKRRTIYYRTRAHHYDYEQSLRVMGTCGHRGVVPVSALRRVAILTPQAVIKFILQACDPLIAIINYQIMGKQHQKFHEWLFDANDDPQFSHLDREGLSVINLSEREMQNGNGTRS